MYELIKRLLFLLPAERAHGFTMKTLKTLNKLPLLRRVVYNKRTSGTYSCMGLEFPSRFGMAAGFDKNATYLKELRDLGFGFVEIGTVTPKPQDGNPKPRLFRLPADHALINRMGFNNDGADLIAERLKAYRAKNGRDLIIGGNIGKNKVTPNEDAASDYDYCYRALFPYVDYFVVNVSSPNTPNLRELQEKEPLEKLFKTLRAAETELCETLNTAPKPILLKIAPDMNDALLEQITGLCAENGLTGIIVSNTTIEREGLKTSNSHLDAIGNGGLSGAPLIERSTAMISRIKEIAPDMLVIGVGGIMSGADAQKKIDAGADLVQIYTGFIYRGPELLSELQGLN